MVKKLLDIKTEDGRQAEGIRFEQASAKDIAIIGIALRLPKAKNLEEYWANLAGRIDCITGIPAVRVADVEDFMAFKGLPVNKYFERGYLEEIDKFDYSFFGMSPKEAALIDPNQRMFLEIAWEAAEDAGYGGDRLKGSRTGVFLGFGSELLYKRLIDEVEPASGAVALPGNLAPVIAGRIAYLLDLKGPSLAIDTACSSALVALHYACQSIRCGECGMAIAGTVSLGLMPVDAGQRIGIESSDGRARAFDDSSDGTGNGEGVAALLLKPLHKAVEDRDHIYAVIKGSAVNQDGSSMGITAPNPAAQEDVIVRAWKNAGIDPETISYIEAHGTGTKLGDPIEIDGIQRAFRRYTSKKAFCAIGSVKSNIGHLDSAAGIAGLLKAVSALMERKLPPTLHFERPNRQIAFEDSPVYVNDRLIDWEAGDISRRCGVSSFGISGTNCHMILEEAPAVPDPAKSSPGPHVLALSAKSEEALAGLLDNYRKLFDTARMEDIADICYTANTGRGHYNCRAAFLIGDGGNLPRVMRPLDTIISGESLSDGIFYGKHSIINDKRRERAEGEITREELGQMDAEANLKLERYLAGGGRETGLLRELLQLYVGGAAVAWNKLYKPGRHRTVRVPVYPFERKRCWIEIPRTVRANPAAVDQLFYRTGWVEKGPDMKSAAGRSTVINVVLKGTGERCNRVITALREKGQALIEAETGDSFAETGEGRYTVSGSQEDFEKLLAVIGSSGKQVRIINLMSMKSACGQQSLEELDSDLGNGVNALFHLVKAIKSAGWKAELELVLAGEYAKEVTGSEARILPENSAMFALGKVAGNEIRNLRCRCIDMDGATSLETIAGEMENPDGGSMVAYREGKRYVEQIMKVDLPSMEDKAIPITEGKVYVITGGLGGLGLETARHLAAKGKLKLALIGRSGMPSRAEWEDILQKNDDRKMCGRIRSILDMERTGSEVVCRAADVSDCSGLDAVLQDLRKKYGAIHGVIHCAGVAGQGFLANKSEETFQSVLLPKIQGTWLLDRLTQNDDLDCFILFSSFASFLGEPGQGDYAAANAYMDAYQAYRSKQGKRTLAINWTSWKETGMSVDFKVNTDGIFKALPTRQALDAFDKVIQKNIPGVIVGELNHESRIFLSADIPLHLSDEIQKEIWAMRRSKGASDLPEMLPEVTLRGRKNGEAYTGAELELGRIWSLVLGLKEINIYDDFFELGGHSLLAARLEAELEKRGMPVDGADVYRYKSIKEMAAIFEGGSGEVPHETNDTNEPDKPYELDKLDKPEKAPETVRPCIRSGGDQYPENMSAETAIPSCCGSRVLENIQPFNDVYYISCFYNSFFPVLTYFNKSIKPFLVNDIVKYEYQWRGIDTAVKYLPAEQFEKVLGDVGIKAEYKQESHDILGDIKASVDGGKPVILWVDCYYEPLRIDTYLKSHLSHTWLVFGYDDDLQCCHIVEHSRSDNLSYEKRVVSYWDVVNSYQGYLVRFQNESTGPSYYAFSLSERDKSVPSDGEYVETYMECAASRCGEIAEELNGLEAFVREADEHLMDEVFMQAEAESIMNILTDLINAKQVERYKFAQLFGEASEIAEQMDKITEYWNNVRKPISRYVFSGIYNRGAMEKASAFLKNIYALEYAMYMEFIYRQIKEDR